MDLKSRIRSYEKEQSRALIDACKRGDKHEVSKLCRHGCDVDLPDKDGLTAVLYAACAGHHEVAEVLCRWDANLNACDQNGRTALHYASTLAYAEVARVLILHQPNIDWQDKEMMTALHLAVDRGHTEIVKVLLSAGASLKLKNLKGQTPEKLAKLKGYSEILRLLHAAKTERQRQTQTSESRNSWKDNVSLFPSSKTYQIAGHSTKSSTANVYGLSFNRLAEEPTATPQPQTSQNLPQKEVTRAHKNATDSTRLPSEKDVLSGNRREQKISSEKDVLSGNRREQKISSEKDVLLGNRREQKISSEKDVLSGNGREQKAPGSSESTCQMTRQSEECAYEDRFSMPLVEESSDHDYVNIPAYVNTSRFVVESQNQESAGRLLNVARQDNIHKTERTSQNRTTPTSLERIA